MTASGDVPVVVHLTPQQHACVVELLRHGIFGADISEVLERLMGGAIRDHILEGWCGEGLRLSTREQKEPRP